MGQHGMPPRTEEPVGNNPLRTRLAQPWRRLGLEEAAHGWHHVRIGVRCVGGGALAADPRTPARIRGALGRRLEEAASPQARAGLPCPWLPPSTLDVLFGNHGKVTGGLDIPKPYVVSAHADGPDLTAEVMLFGFAGDLAEAVAEALVRGLRTGLNEGDVDHARYRPLDVTDRWIESFDGVNMESDGRDILLVTMRTPLSIRSGASVKAPDLGDLISSLTARVQGMARWQDTDLAADWAALVAEGRALRHHEAAPSAPRLWRRGSSRQDRCFEIGGGLAQWLVDVPSLELRRLLAIGQTVGAGGRTSLGLGRFDIQRLSTSQPPVGHEPRR